MAGKTPKGQGLELLDGARFSLDLKGGKRRLARRAIKGVKPRCDAPAFCVDQGHRNASLAPRPSEFQQRGRTESKHHLTVDGHGTPLAVILEDLMGPG